MSEAVETPIPESPARPVDLPAAPTRPMARRRPQPLLLLTAAAVLGAAWGWHRYQFARSHVTSDNAQVDGHITPIAPKVEAFVAAVRVDDNMHVNAGDTLVILDDRDFKLRLLQTQAELATAAAAVGTGRKTGQSQAQLAWSEAQALGAQATVAQKEAQFRKAESDLERVRGLAAKQIVPAQQLDAAQAAYDAAQAELEAVRRQAAAAGSQVSAYGAAVGAAEARLEAARAAADNAQLQVSYTVVTAPVSGIIARRSVEPGALVQVGQTLMSIIPDRGLWVTANLKETELENVAVGEPVKFTVDAYPGRTFAGHVESLSPATGARFALLPPDNATGNFTKVVQRVPVRIAVDRGADAAHPLRPGVSVVVEIKTR
jgi:membrane fusion protein (multidrug efflux system)